MGAGQGMEGAMRAFRFLMRGAAVGTAITMLFDDSGHVRPDGAVMAIIAIINLALAFVGRES